jgi:hypothetical protein
MRLAPLHDAPHVVTRLAIYLVCVWAPFYITASIALDALQCLLLLPPPRNLNTPLTGSRIQEKYILMSSISSSNRQSMFRGARHPFSLIPHSSSNPGLIRLVERRITMDMVNHVTREACKVVQLDGETDRDRDSELTSYPTSQRPKHAQDATVSLRDFIVNVVKKSNIQAPTFLTTLIYFERLRVTLPSVSHCKCISICYPRSLKSTGCQRRLVQRDIVYFWPRLLLLPSI